MIRTPIVLVNGIRKPLPPGDTVEGLVMAEELPTVVQSAVGSHNHDALYAPLHTHPYEPANSNIQAHVASAHASANAQKNSDITKAEIEAVLTGPITSHSHSGGSSAFLLASLAADVTNNNAVANTLADVTGLSFPVVAGQRYWFRFVIRYTAALATTGSRWSINGPAFTELTYASEYPLTATTRTTNEALNAYNLPAASNASSIVAGNTARIEGFILPSASGNVIARFASEIANSAIIARRGSMVQYALVG